MNATPLQARALYEEVADRLRQRIFNRELPPGAWIDEMKIAQELGISRTPLREAIKVLAAEGLVTMKVRRGAYVTEVSSQDLREVYELLALLEADAAEAVCWRATDEELTELARLHAELEAAADHAQHGSRERFFELNEAFHLRVLDLGGNRWRKQLVLDLRKVMKLHRHASLAKEGRVAESLAEHRAILQALQARDRQAAVDAVRRHFANGLQAAI
ncbi:putative D-xylose utilization operon transcriptional repressor [Tepidimonas alkaliphilus]|uniref:Putative D-xylose utilization operon transcriptional repressor n=1 Tax=Tepidimonas alkaliphilus TaxID=2588942 RepID=A0A554WAE3_9BURK|nr:GntR family transcriptional regulator [Tepidimonas alkaliphilus]TSE20547.1 putative D-xylose utilization operon transcriptional repressor [Tepidimonas alkaliphilus]